MLKDFNRCIAESVYPRKRDAPRGFLDAIVGDTKRQVENKRVEAVMSAGSIEHDLLRALEVSGIAGAHRNSPHHLQERQKSDVPVTLPLHDRSFDLVLLSNWEDEIVYQPSDSTAPSTLENNNLTTPVNKALESGAWTQSIIWSPNAPFRDFAQLELNEEDLAEEHPQGYTYLTY